MQKKEIVEKLTGKYRFVEQEDRLMLMEQNGERVKVVGVLYFKKGKLSYVSKGWGEYEGFQMDTLGKTLLSLFQNLKKGGLTSANIAVGSTREPQNTTHTIQMDFGKKKIRIKIFEGQMASPHISIFEELGEEENVPPRLFLPKESPALMPEKDVEKGGPFKEGEIESPKTSKSSRPVII
ncbi:MAG TPA: hypothetical protein VGB26_15695 [Nitrospiria bacterium]